MVELLIMGALDLRGLLATIHIYLFAEVVVLGRVFADLDGSAQNRVDVIQL